MKRRVIKKDNIIIIFHTLWIKSFISYINEQKQRKLLSVKGWKLTQKFLYLSSYTSENLVSGTIYCTKQTIIFFRYYLWWVLTVQYIIKSKFILYFHWNKMFYHTPKIFTCSLTTTYLMYYLAIGTCNIMISLH